MPAIGAAVVVEVEDTSWMVPWSSGGVVMGQVLAVQFAGNLPVSDIIDSTHVELTNLGYANNAAAGSVIPAGARVGVSGDQGVTGSTPGGGLLVVNNLNDVADIPTSRANLGLGTMAVQNANAVAITGGNVSGITDLAVTDGGTGGSSAAAALANLGAAASGLATASGLTISAADKVLGRAAGPGPVQEIPCTATGRSILAAASIAAAKALLGIGWLSVVTKVISYSATTNDDVILCDATTGPLAVGLPSAATSAGKTLTIKKIDASANAVTVTGDLITETIDGAITQTIGSQWTAIEVVCDGLDWFII